MYSAHTDMCPTSLLPLCQNNKVGELTLFLVHRDKSTNIMHDFLAGERMKSRPKQIFYDQSDNVQ